MKLWYKSGEKRCNLVKNEILEVVREKVIKPFEVLTKCEIETFNKFFFNQLEELWKGKILEENLFSTEDIFSYPLEVAYLLYCYKIRLEEVIQDKSMLMEYWDFYLENYPELKFKEGIEEFYRYLRKQ